MNTKYKEYIYNKRMKIKKKLEKSNCCKFENFFPF